VKEMLCASPQKLHNFLLPKGAESSYSGEPLLLPPSCEGSSDSPKSHPF